MVSSRIPREDLILDESFEFFECLTFDVIFATEKHTVLSLHQILFFQLCLLLVFRRHFHIPFHNCVPKHVVNEVQVIQ